jgi:hypothetical protein
MDLPYPELFRVEVDSIANWKTWQSDCKVTYVDEEENEKEYGF